MILMVSACALLSIQSIIMVPEESSGIEKSDIGVSTDTSKVLPSWIPVIISFVTPFIFTAGNITIKYLNEETYGIGFTSEQLSRNPIMIVNFLGLVVGTFIWTSQHPV